MRNRVLALSCIAVLALLVVPGAWSQAPPTPVDKPDLREGAKTTGEPSESDSDDPDTDESDSTDSDSDEPDAILVVETDAPCTLWIDNLAEGQLHPDTPREIGVDSGTVVVKATSLVAPEAAWTETYEMEDGERLEVTVEMAETLEAFRKLERRERIYPDFDTRLMWPNRDNGWDLTWEAAGRHCQSLELGGFDNWRLPTIEELGEVQAMWSQAAYKTVGDIRLSACCPWSSTRVDERHALNFSFRHRRAFQGHVEYSYDMRALCVRDAHQEISDDPKEIARQRKLQKQKRKEREQRKAEKEARRKG
ncbi:MAG: DUF1566 domain-containing protein [Acidobacteriota bacterium]|nr:DUF1566 domain-containing protein [Acidobacteriota bacterium]